MDFKIPSDYPVPKPAVSQVDNLLAQLRSAGRIEAEVVKLLQGNQLLLSSRLGHILTSNSLNYKPGDRVYLRLEGSERQPVLKASPMPAKPVILDSRKNADLVKLLPPDRPMLARVVSTVAQRVEVQLAEQTIKLPREVLPVKSQLLSLQRNDRQNHIEVRPIDSKAIYKAIIKQLVPRQSENSTSSLVRLLDLVASATTAPPRTAPQKPGPNRQAAVSEAGTASSKGLKANDASRVSPGQARPAVNPGSGIAQLQGDTQTRASVTAAGRGSTRSLPAVHNLVTGSTLVTAKPGTGPTAALSNDTASVGARPATIMVSGKPVGTVESTISIRPGQAKSGAITAWQTASPVTDPAKKASAFEKSTRSVPAVAPAPDRTPAQLSQLAGHAALAASANRMNITAVNSPATPPRDIGLTPSPALQPLLQLITRFPEIDASALKKWLEFARLAYTAKNDSTPSPATDIFRLLKQFGDDQGYSRELTRSIHQNPANAREGESSASRNPVQDALLQQAREGARLVEQSLSQNLLQRASLGFQQETQQPLSLSLALPFLDDQQTKSLQIELKQRNRAQREEDKSWDIRLNFDLAGLGAVSCHLVLEGHSVAASFYSEQAQTRERIEMELPQLRQQLSRAGFTAGEFHSFPGKSVSTKNPTACDFAESLIDIEV